MLLKMMSSSLRRNNIFLIGMLIIYLISLVECSNANQIQALANEIKKNELGKIMLETFQIDHISKDKNFSAFEKTFNTFKDIIEYKAKEHSYVSQYYSNYNSKCENDIFDLKTKAKAVKNIFSQTNNEKLKNDLKIKNHKMLLDVFKSMKKHYSDKAHLFTKIQKKFFMNKYILLPVLEDLIDFTKYVKAHILLLKRNYSLTDKKEIHMIINEFFQGDRFKKLNKNLNLVESDSIIAFENHVKYQNEVKESSQEFLKSTKTNDFAHSSKKCIVFSLESYSNSFLNIDDFFKKIFNNHNNQFKRIVYCSDYIAVLRYFSLNFNSDFYNEKWNLKGLDRIYKLFKLIEKTFEQKVDFINMQFEEITHKFSGSSSYLNSQIKYLQDKEDEINKEIKLIEEGSFASKAQDENATETKYLEDLIAFKTQFSKAEGSLGFELFKDESDFLGNVKRLNKIISFDYSTINEIFENRKDFNNKKPEVSNEKVISFVEIENVFSYDNMSVYDSKSVDIEDIDFDAI